MGGAVGIGDRARKNLHVVLATKTDSPPPAGAPRQPRSGLPKSLWLLG
jgi:hypothetical protein